jgi:hypothetical protein
MRTRVIDASGPGRLRYAHVDQAGFDAIIRRVAHDIAT